MKNRKVMYAAPFASQIGDTPVPAPPESPPPTRDVPVTIEPSSNPTINSGGEARQRKVGIFRTSTNEIKIAGFIYITL